MRSTTVIGKDIRAAFIVMLVALFFMYAIIITGPKNRESMALRRGKSVYGQPSWLGLVGMVGAILLGPDDRFFRAACLRMESPAKNSGGMSYSGGHDRAPSRRDSSLSISYFIVVIAGGQKCSASPRNTSDNQSEADHFETGVVVESRVGSSLNIMFLISIGNAVFAGVISVLACQSLLSCGNESLT